MKNRYKIFAGLMLSIVLIGSCSKKVYPYSIYFSGVGAIFQREVDYIYPGHDFSIGICPIDNYVIDEDDFTIKVGGIKSEASDSTWRMSNNLLTIKKPIITDNIDVSVTARPKELQLNIINPDPRIHFSNDKPYAGEDFNLHMRFDTKYGIKVKNIIVGKFFNFTNYTLRKESPNEIESENYYVLSIDQKHLNGNISVEFELIENFVTISNSQIELNSHDSGAIAYFYPNTSFEPEISVEINGTELAKKAVKCSIDETYKIINVDVTNEFGNTDVKVNLEIKDKNTGVLLNSALVNIKNPSNIQEALDSTVLGIINNKLNEPGSDEVSFKVFWPEMVNYTCNQWNNLLEIYGRDTNALTYKGKEPDQKLSQSTTFSCHRLANFGLKETGLTKDHDKYFENLTNINYLNHKVQNVNGGRPCYIENIYKRLVVRNSDEMFWAVEHGYRPEFVKEGTVEEEIYENAKELCRQLTDDKMNKLQMARIFFEYLNKEIHYDYNLVDERTKEDYIWYEHQGNLLESVFLKEKEGEQPKMKAAVHEGLSKAFAFMCGIVGIPCFRTYGISKDAIHTYNYVKVQGIWYLVCPTWCRIETEVPDVVKMYDAKVSLLDYTSFLSSKYYFSDYSKEYDYTDLLWQLEIRSERAYSDAPITSLDFTVDDRTFYLQSDEDAIALKSVIDKYAGKETFACLSYPTRYSDNADEWNKIIVSGYTGQYKIYRSIGEVFTQQWILFN